MTNLKRWISGRLGLLLFAVIASLAGEGFLGPASNATTIRYTVEKLGGSVYQYDYRLSGSSFGASTGAAGFDVYFDPTLYTLLDPNPAEPSSDWFVFTTAPNPALPADGSYTAEANVSGASLADPFIVSFTWLGKNAPGSQSFDVIDSDFNVLEQGRTLAADAVVPTPEPSSISLIAGLVIGLAVIGVRRPRGRVGNAGKA